LKPGSQKGFNPPVTSKGHHKGSKSMGEGGAMILNGGINSATAKKIGGVV
jgi:hypothetical protein